MESIKGLCKAECIRTTVFHAGPDKTVADVEYATAGWVDCGASSSCPDRASIIRLVGAVLAEQHDDWAEGRRYLGLDVLTRSQATNTNQEATTELTLQALTA